MGLVSLMACSSGVEGRVNLQELHERVDANFDSGFPHPDLDGVNSDLVALLDDPVGRGFVEQLAERHASIAYDEATQALCYLGSRAEGTCLTRLRAQGGAMQFLESTLPPRFVLEELAAEGSELLITFRATGEATAADGLAAGRYRSRIDSFDEIVNQKLLVERAEALEG